MRLLALLSAITVANWPQAAGPDGTWSVPDAKPPISWSVALNRNILWRTPLPNGGQSGIAVWGDRLFLTTFEPYRPGDTEVQRHNSGALPGCAHGKDSVVGEASKDPVKSPMMYAYSDSTSPLRSPMASTSGFSMPAAKWVLGTSAAKKSGAANISRGASHIRSTSSMSQSSTAIRF